MCVESLNTLRDHGLIKMDEGFDLKPTGIREKVKYLQHKNPSMLIQVHLFHISRHWKTNGKILSCIRVDEIVSGIEWDRRLG